MRLTNGTLSRLRVRKEVGPTRAHSLLTGDATPHTEGLPRMKPFSTLVVLL